MSERFFSREPIREQQFELDGDEAHHLLRVMRRQVGDEAIVFDNSEDEFRVRIVAATRSSATLEVLERTRPARELTGQLTVAAALPKGDRQRFLVEKCVELGVTRFIPLQTSRGVAESTPAAIARLQRYVIEAAKQSGRTRLMEIHPPQSSRQLFNDSTLLATERWLADPSGTSSLSEMNGPAQTIAVGPEGGWTPEELAEATAAGWRAVTLGARTLRVETAAVAAAAIAAQYLQAW